MNPLLHHNKKMQNRVRHFFAIISKKKVRVILKIDRHLNLEKELSSKILDVLKFTQYTIYIIIYTNIH